jgi:plasmid stability protein
MPVNLSIKNAPDDVVERLRERAKRNHRSLQGELLAIVEEASRPTPQRLSPMDVLTRACARGLRAEPGEAAALVRADRDNH